MQGAWALHRSAHTHPLKENTMPSDPKPHGLTRRRTDQLGTEGERALPRRPDERDESTDSQDQDHVRGVIHQAHDDVVQGQQDTDRKPALDEAYEKQKGPGAPGTKPAAPDLSGAGAGLPGAPRKAR
jgi:hypothetical protein